LFRRKPGRAAPDGPEWKGPEPASAGFRWSFDKGDAALNTFILASDYDGTLAKDGVVDAATLAALERLRRSGRRAVLVTGREMEDLRRVFDRFDLFDCVVAENGALLLWPEDGREEMLAPAPPSRFVARLQERKVTPLSVGRAIVATREPYDSIVRQTIRDFGLDLELTFNKGAVMVLPPGVDKASGLIAALRRMNVPLRNTVGIGDAENDQAFLRLCGCGVAVANALPALKENADFVTAGARGAGVAELIDRMIATDLAEITLRNGC
jgi:HAD superfamily hydrolase (TIGR01484 family)